MKDNGKEELQLFRANRDLPDALLPGVDSPDDTQDSELNIISATTANDTSGLLS